MSIGRITEVAIGTLAVIGGAVLGAYLTAKYTHEFQEKLLVKQLAAQQKLFEEQKAFQKTLLTRQYENQMKVERERQQFEDYRDFRNRH